MVFTENNNEGLYDVIKEIRSNKFCDFYKGFCKFLNAVVEKKCYCYMFYFLYKQF